MYRIHFFEKVSKGRVIYLFLLPKGGLYNGILFSFM